MNFIKGTIKASPFVGVFAALSEDFIFAPHGIQEKEAKDIERKLGAEMIKCSIANSALIGVFGKALGNKIALPEIAGDDEVRLLEKSGIDVIRLKGVLALGNLLALNSKGGIASPLIEGAQLKELRDFFGIKIITGQVAGSDLSGAGLVVTNKGFIVHQNTNEKELKSLEKLFGVKGTPTTANYGDRFVGNDVIANSKGAVVGKMTTSFEMMRIDEALTGD